MKLHSPQFSREVSRLLKAECRANRVLRKAVRRARRRVLRYAFPFIAGRLFWSLMLGVFILALYNRGLPASAAAAVVAIWFLQVVLAGQNVVRTQLGNIPPALLLLPFSSAQLDRLVQRRILGLLWRPCADALVALGFLACIYHAGLSGWLAVIPLAALYAVGTWGLSVWLIRFSIPRSFTFLIAIWPFVLAMCMNSSRIKADAAIWLAAHAESISLVSPGGWLTSAFLGAIGVLPHWWLIGLLPALPLVAFANWVWRDLTRRLETESRLLWRWFGESSLTQRTLANVALTQQQDAKERQIKETETAEPFSLAGWRASVLDLPQQGWMERLFVRWLSPRERLVMECAVKKLPAWTQVTKNGLLMFLLAVLLALPAAHLPSNWSGILYAACGVSAVIGSILALPLASGFDRMLARGRYFQIVVAQPALYPVTLGEFANLATKAAVIRGCVIAPAFALAGGILAWIFSTSPWWLMGLGIKLVALSVTAAPWLTMMAVSAASNDSQIRGLRGLRSAGLMLGTTLLLIVAAITTLCAPWAWSLCAFSSFVAIAFLGARGYARAYNHGAFDLLQGPRS